MATFSVGRNKKKNVPWRLYFSTENKLTNSLSQCYIQHNFQHSLSCINQTLSLQQDDIMLFLLYFKLANFQCLCFRQPPPLGFNLFSSNSLTYSLFLFPPPFPNSPPSLALCLKSPSPNPPPSHSPFHFSPSILSLTGSPLPHLSQLPLTLFLNPSSHCISLHFSHSSPSSSPSQVTPHPTNLPHYHHFTKTCTCHILFCLLQTLLTGWGSTKLTFTC